MQTRIQGTTMPVLEVQLDPNESVFSKSGELSWMTQSIQMSTHTQMGGGGGSPESCVTTRNCSGPEEMSVCSVHNAVATCACYSNLTPIGTCSQLDDTGPQPECTLKNCCAVAFGAMYE